MRWNPGYFGLTVLLVLALCCTFEQRAYAYIDPGSGLLIFQGIGAVVSGVLFTFRRRLKAMFSKSDRAGERTASSTGTGGVS